MRNDYQCQAHAHSMPSLLNLLLSFAYLIITRNVASNVITMILPASYESEAIGLKNERMGHIDE